MTLQNLVLICLSNLIFYDIYPNNLGCRKDGLVIILEHDRFPSLCPCSSRELCLANSHHLHLDLSTYYTQDLAHVSALPQSLICKKCSVYICWMDG